MFSTHFSGSRPHQTTIISLLGIRQEQGEPLRPFIDRFSKATLRTPHLNQEMILQCMALILQPDPLANNVYLHPLASMHELKLHAADYVRMEEMQTLHTKFYNDYAATTAALPRHLPALTPAHANPTNLASPDILNKALQADLIPPPRKTTTPPNVNMTKYCRYHRNYGHTTEDCKAFQDKIEELVCAGHFCCYIRRDDHSSRSRHPPRSDHRRPPHDSRHDRRPPQPANQEPAPTSPLPTPLRGTINTISGGFASGGPSLLPERNTSTISNPSIISPIPTTNVVCLPSSS